jgi:glyoxylase-like metal-dependent hydrolase (beta-lactamase superfamily II)
MVFALAGCSALAALATVAAAPFAVDPLADGVYLFRPAGDTAGRANSLVVERRDGVLVVDAQPTPQAARELLEEIARRIGKPVRYLVLSHPHADAAGGAAAFPDPVVLVGSAGCRDALLDPAFDFGGEARARAASAWAEPPRRAPVVVLFAKTVLADERNAVELFPVSRGHSSGDLMVQLPGPDVLYAGDLLFPDGNPFAGDADVGGWLETLNQIVRESPRVTVPLRGPALAIEAIRAQRDALAWVRGEVEAGFADRLPLEEVAQRVLDAPDIEKRFSRTASPSFLPGLVERVIAESVERRRKRGTM